MNTFVTMEVLNECQNLKEVMPLIPEKYQVVVVDDGSTDGSGDAAAALGARVVRHPFNLGQGVAFVTGVKAAIRCGAELIVHIDGDGQHDPRQIPQFEAYLTANPEVDVVVGSRRLGTNEGALWIRRAFLPLFNGFVNWICGYHISDYLCGFRAYRVSSLNRVMHIFDDYYNAQYNATEMFIGFSHEDIRVAEIPVDIKPRSRGRSYKGNIKYGMNILIALAFALNRWNGRRS